MKMQSLKILVIEDHELVRKGICELIRLNPNVTEVIEAGNIEEGLKKIKEENPVIVFLDINLPEEVKPEIIGEIRKIHKNIKIIILTQHEDDDYILRYLMAGSDGYLTKNSCVAELTSAIDIILAGKSYYSDRISKKLFSFFVSQSVPPNFSSISTLTEREKEIFSLLVHGVSAKDIATKFNISLSTVQNHRDSILKKLNLSTQTDLIYFAINNRLIDLNSIRPQQQ